MAGIKEILGLSDVPWVNGKNGKWSENRIFFESISINFGRSDGWIWVEMSGQGCRAFETYGNGDYDALFQLVKDNPGDMKLTRLDVAYDDHEGLLDIELIAKDTREQQYISKSDVWEVCQGSKGTSVYHGSDQSEILIRIYDKAAERKLTDGSHWIRVEMQLRRDRALQFISSLNHVGDTFCGVVLNYLRYVEEIDDSNKWRWPLKQYWADMLYSAERISLYVKPGTEYNMIRMTNYVFRQAGNAIDATIQVLGFEGFMDELRSRETRPNPKYNEVVKQMKRGEV